MFQAYLTSIDSLNEKYKKYAIDVTKHVIISLEKELPLYAVHGFCTDGGTAGAMIRYAVPEAAIVPLDYWILNDKHARTVLQQIPWVGIVDLEPFNTKKIDFWVDHHLSSVGKQIIANKIRFDTNGDSGSWQLLLSSFLGEMPDHLVELAVMTRTTDTAGYITSPPTSLINDLTELDLNKFEGEEGRKQEEQRIWLLDDCWGSVFTLKEHFQMYNYLAKDGFFGISNVLDRIRSHRLIRRKAIDIANGFDTSSDVVLFVFREDSVDKFTILRKLQEKGVKVVISLSKTVSGVRISLRRNKKLTEKEAENIKLNELAALMNGGGHAGASGAFTDTIEDAISIISNWFKKRNMTVNVEELN